MTSFTQAQTSEWRQLIELFIGCPSEGVRRSLGLSLATLFHS